MTELFTLGATVYDKRGKAYKIGKILKNERFMVDGLPSRMFKITYNETTAWEVGSSWSKMMLYADTPENREKMTATRQLNHATNLICVEIQRLRTLLRIADREPELAKEEALRIEEVNATFGR